MSNQSFNRVLVEIVGPLLIMLMIGSLVFFLIEIFYRGPHSLRLGWVLGLFTAASVLVSRISIEEGLERAALFGFALSAATLFAAVKLVDFEYGDLFFLEPVALLFLIAVVMWSANRLTWDCTVIDASRDVSSIGLAERVKRKVFRRRSNWRLSPENPVVSETKPAQDKPNRPWFVFFANSKTQNTPGLWVLYFALAAFPIFGLGQWFSQPDLNWGYRWIFLLFAIYLGSALGLLMLTSLLGLERYLRKRGAVMPSSISINWIVTGTVFALSVMLIMLLLPNPRLSTAWQDALAFLTTNNKDTSVHAFGDNGQVDNDRHEIAKPKQDARAAEKKPGERVPEQDEQGQASRKTGEARGDGSSDAKKTGGSSDSRKETRSPDHPNRDSSTHSDQEKAPEQDDSRKQFDDAKRNENQNRIRNEVPQKKDQSDKRDEQQDAKQDAKQANQRDPNPDDRNQPANQRRGGKQQAESSKPFNARPLTQLAKFLGGTLKYLVYVVSLVALIVMLWMFRDELAKLWAELFARKVDGTESGTNQVQPKPADNLLPRFSQFKDPFISGCVNRWPPARTIQYSFEGLEAWARGHRYHREQDQTALEFVTRLQPIDKGVAAEARLLADLIGECQYSGKVIERSDTLPLRQLWRLMNANVPKQDAMATATELQITLEP